MMRPTKFLGRSSGIAIVAVLISAVIFLGIIVAITGTLSVSSRKSTGDQRVTLEAQYAAESGLSRVVAEAQNGVLQNWTSLLLGITPTNSTTTTTLKQLAKQFCNIPDTTTITDPAVSATGATYCTAQAGTDLTERYELLSTLIPYTAYAALTPAVTISDKAGAEKFWKDVFSDGPSGSRYATNFTGGATYAVTFGLQAVGVQVIDGSKYRFRMKPRDAISTGQFISDGLVISKRVSQRNFSAEYYIDLAPPKLSYFLSLTNTQIAPGGGSGDEVYLTKDVLLNGPVHTNGAFYFTGNPWINGEVTSAGCPGGYTTNATTKVSTCTSVVPVTGFYKDGSSAPTKFTVTNGFPDFPGYAVGSAVTATAPELALQNASADNKPKPWKYPGKYDAAIIALPTTSVPERTKAGLEGILIPTSADPVGSGFYANSPGDSNANPPKPAISNLIYLQATTDGRTTKTSFAKVPNNGKVATAQIIQMNLKQKVERCNAVATGIDILPKIQTTTVGTPKTFTATVTGQDLYTYEFAPTVKTVTWTTTKPTTLTTGAVTGETAGSTSSAATATYNGTAGYAVEQAGSAPVTITATTSSGNKSATATLTVNPNAPTVSLTASPDTLFYGGSSGSTLNWGFGPGNGPFTQLLEQSTDNGSTWATVAGAPTTSTGSDNKSFPVTPKVDTRYRLTAQGPTGLPGAGTAAITVTPPAKPVIDLSISPKTTIPFEGDSRKLAWSVNNANATGSSSGAGNGPFTFILQQSVNGSAFTDLKTITAPPTGSMHTYTIPENLTGLNKVYSYQVIASSVVGGQTYTGTSAQLDVTQVKPALPQVDLTTSTSKPLPYGGGKATLVLKVYNTITDTDRSNNSGVGIAGTGPYTYQLQVSYVGSGSGYTDIGTPVAFLTPSTLTSLPQETSTGPAWYKAIVTNTKTGLQGSDWEDLPTATLPLPTIEFTSSSYDVAKSGDKVSLSYKVTNAANSEITGDLTQPIQTNVIPNGVTTSNTITGVSITKSPMVFTLTASNAVGTVTRTVSVYISTTGQGAAQAVKPPPVINTFVGDPVTVYYPSTSSTLRWTLSGGAPDNLSLSGKLVPSGTTVSGLGAQTKTALNKGVTLTGNTDYTLTASNTAGSVSLNTRVYFVPAAAPEVTLKALDPNPVSYLGGKSTLSWNVNNTAASGTKAGSGSATDKYTYEVEELISNVWKNVTTLTNRTASDSYEITALANNTTSDVNRRFRIIAKNTTTDKLGPPSNERGLKISAPDLPIATISASSTDLSYKIGGNTTTISWGVSNNTAAGAGTGPYTYTVEKKSPGGDWGVMYTGTDISSNQTITLSGETYYRVTAKNDTTKRSSTNLPGVSVTYALPEKPTVTLSANPTSMTTSAGGTTTLSWTLGGGPVTGLTIDGIGNVFGTSSKPNVSVNTTTTFTIRATGPGAPTIPVIAQVTVTVPPPPQTLDGFDKLGIDATYTQDGSAVGAVNPSWKGVPKWSGGAGTQPTITAGMYKATVSPVVNPVIVNATPDANGNVTLNIAAITTAEEKFTVTLTLTVPGNAPRSVSWDVTVKQKTFKGSLRPRARLTQATLDCAGLGLDGPVSYDWATFIDYFVEKDNTLWKRTYPSQSQSGFVRPDDTDAIWVKQDKKFNGIVYVDNGVSVQGPARSVITDPTTAAPAIANFAALTIATGPFPVATAAGSKLTVIDDLKYENPVCTSAPVRGTETVAGSNNGVVTPATCPATGWSRNVLGLFSSGSEGIEYKTQLKNTTIQAISLASNSQIQVARLPKTSSDPCPDELKGIKDLGSINIQGGLIQSTYGEFGQYISTGATACGYKRTMTYDVRMKDPNYAPPGFPEADNAKPVVKLFSVGSNGTPVEITSGQSLPLPVGFSRIK